MRNKVSRATGVAAAALGVVVVVGSIIGGFVLASNHPSAPADGSTVNVSNDQGTAPDGDDADDQGGTPGATRPARNDGGTPPSAGAPGSGSATQCADDDADDDSPHPGDDDDDADDDC